MFYVFFIYFYVEFRGFYTAIERKHFMYVSVDTYIVRKHQKFRFIFSSDRLNNSYSGGEKAVIKMLK